MRARHFLAIVLVFGLSASTARAGYVDITYSFAGSTVVITNPIHFTITGVNGGTTFRFSDSTVDSHPNASATVPRLSFALTVPLNALGGRLTGEVRRGMTNTVGTAHFNGRTVIPSPGAYQFQQLTGFLHYHATFHYMNSYSYPNHVDVIICTMTVGVPYSQISQQYGITGSTQIPLPTLYFYVGGTGSNLGSSFVAKSPFKQQLANFPFLGSAYINGREIDREHQVPEAGSTVLLGFGLAGLLGISLAGRGIQRR